MARVVQSVNVSYGRKTKVSLFSCAYSIKTPGSINRNSLGHYSRYSKKELRLCSAYSSSSSGNYGTWYKYTYKHFKYVI